jgi:hypothetical protein
VGDRSSFKLAILERMNELLWQGMLHLQMKTREAISEEIGMKNFKKIATKGI